MIYQAAYNSWLDEDKVKNLCGYLDQLAKKSIRGTDEFKGLTPTKRINIAVYLDNIIEILDKKEKS